MFPRVFILALVLVAPLVTHAQAIPPELARTITLSATPAHPEPGSDVDLRITSTGIDLPRSLIIWYVDGREVARGPGRTDLRITVGALGSASRIEVIAEDPEGILGRAQSTIRPTEVDLLWESTAYAPPFYEGRVLPGSGADIRMHALARFARSDGSRVPESDLVYVWSRNDRVLPEISGRGRSSATIPAPTLFARDTIKVRVESIDGSLSGNASVPLTTSDPILHAYPLHPLFGILYHRSIISAVRSTDQEERIVVEPYFADIPGPAHPSLIYEWQLNGRRLASPETRPNILILDARGFSGLADIRLTLTSAVDWLLRTEGRWAYEFGTSAQNQFSGTGGGGNPFLGTQE